MFSSVLSVVVACTIMYMYLQCTEVNAMYEPSSCAIWDNCNNCNGDKIGMLGIHPVCCPNCISRYFNYGYDADLARYYCNCNFLDLFGNASRGEECEQWGMTTYGSLNEMPICCPDPFVLVNKGQVPDGVHMDCEQRGNCWRGSQCSICTNDYGVVINGVKLCCANCAEDVFNITTGEEQHCSCHKKTSRQ